MATVAEFYGRKVFNDHVMQERLPTATYNMLSKTIEEGKPLDLEVANIIAHAMKEWAIEQGATHFTHWFQPLTGITSEKHDAFINPQPDGRALMTFSGEELIQSEPDASSFPSGGLRATFEARGYTAWDPTSYAFIKDNVLCIPTVFCSYTGEALDKKTPLLRSMSAFSKQACKVLHLFGIDVPNVKTMCGPEQEYFLIRKEEYEIRQDIMITGRSLFGAAPCKGQELSEHYFGSIRHKVLAFMQEVDSELWELGISAKTRHNEVAPTQHELAIIYTDTNRAIDYNLLTMEVMRKVAAKHGLVCLQHEKPFAGINGSGKHNNWSIKAGDINVLEPGVTDSEQLRFLVFLTAMIEAADEYQGLLRASVASAGNDMRLGADEAPPAIISIFLGDELTAHIEAIIAGEDYEQTGNVRMDLGVATLPALLKDNTDRNRTSPLAFTGNKFEFRMPGSAVNLSDINTVINTAMAKALSNFLAYVEGAGDFEEAARAWVKKTLIERKRIIFNGDGYSDEWKAEAQRRGLLNLASTPDAIPVMIEQKSIDLFKEFEVLNEAEIQSRYEVKLEQYSKILNIEGKTMSHMTRRKILPAVTEFAGMIASTIVAKKAACPGIECTADEELLQSLNDGANAIGKHLKALDSDIEHAQSISGDWLASARAYHDEVLQSMTSLREVVDGMEGLVSTKLWPVPTYNKILFYI